VNTDTTKAMQEALQAAVKRMTANQGGDTGSNGNTNGSGSGNVVPPPSDPISVLAAVIPKFFQNNDDREDLADKIDDLKKGELAVLHAELQLMRKQLHRTFKMQQDLLTEVRQLQQQHLSMGHAVLDLAAQLARVEIIQEPSADAYEQEGEQDARQRGSSPIAGDQTRSRRTNEQGRPEPRLGRK
jgi:hypothetical protein